MSVRTFLRPACPGVVECFLPDVVDSRLSAAQAKGAG